MVKCQTASQAGFDKPLLKWWQQMIKLDVLRFVYYLQVIGETDFSTAWKSKIKV